MNVSVIGAGYVGLITAVGLASKGHSVVSIDADATKVALINQGKAPISEEGLEQILAKCVRDDGSLQASLDYQRVLGTDMTLICVDTPSDPDGSIDLSSIKDSVTRIGKVLSHKEKYHVVVTRSTIIPGTTKQVVIPLLEEYSGKRVGEAIGVAVNPEFMQEGKALQTFFNCDRIIIGEHDQRAGDMVLEIYQGFSAPVVRTDVTTAEMIKYASNAFLATKISFINEIGNICKKLGIDVYAVAKGISFDYRIGDRFLNAGIGFGGSCLPKDLQALVSASSRGWDYPPRLLESVLTVNKDQMAKIVDMTERKLGSLHNKKIAVLGLAFKPDTIDIRNAPAIWVIKALLEKGASISAYDPEAMPNARQVLTQGVRFCHSAAEAIGESDCVLILTEWDEFRKVGLYKGKTVIDGRRALDPEKARVVCDYEGICW
jgi:UDPglucose 6-dehydrogenase